MNEQDGNKQEVRNWLERLRSGSEREQVEAASELSRLHIRSRGAVRTRGAVTRAASAALNTEELHIVLNALRDESPAVRREVAFAVGEWGDEQAISLLSEMARRDDSTQVRIAATDALAKIGGPAAVNVLQILAQEDPNEDVRASAIRGLADLALASVPGSLAEKSVRVRGAIRTGSAEPAAGSEAWRQQYPVVARIKRLLEDIRRADSSHYVRSLAGSALADLDE